MTYGEVDTILSMMAPALRLGAVGWSPESAASVRDYFLYPKEAEVKDPLVLVRVFGVSHASSRVFIAECFFPVELFAEENRRVIADDMCRIGNRCIAGEAA